MKEFVHTALRLLVGVWLLFSVYLTLTALWLFYLWTVLRPLAVVITGSAGNFSLPIFLLEIILAGIFLKETRLFVKGTRGITRYTKKQLCSSLICA